MYATDGSLCYRTSENTILCANDMNKMSQQQSNNQ